MNISENKNKNQKKHFLHELLSEDQEPFLLDTYINKKRPTNYNNNNSHQTNTALRNKNQKPIIQQHKNKDTDFFPINLCRNSCFNTNRAQDTTKSPLFKIPKQQQSNNNSNNGKSSCCSSPNTVFLHVPARTASILLEAALRIQKHSKTKTHYRKNKSFGLLGSLFKRLTQRNKKKIQKIEDQKGNSNYNKNNNVRKVKDILRFEFDSCSVFGERKTEKTEDHEKHYCGACFFEDDDGDGDKHGFFCKSPFRFVLQRSPSSSSGRRMQEFSLPPATPTCRRTEDKESSNNGEDNINKFQSCKEEEEEEEKEQCSPLSVLDPPFEDDDDVHENDYGEEDGFDLECSYPNVQGTKQQLLYRLCRFEKLAELDPLELEKRMLDQDNDECETSIEDNNSETFYVENKELKELVYAILCNSRIHNRGQVSEDLTRLVHDLVMEEEMREVNSLEDREMVIEKVCERLELWKEVDSNTIDMMVDEDFSREESGWKKKSSQEVKDFVGELELAIFTLLVEEFSEELRG